MVTKTISARGTKGHHDFTLSVQEDRTENNSSYLSFSFKISATNSSWQWRSYSNITYSITIGDNTYTGTIPNFNGSTTTLKTDSNIEIPHESDGTKTINIAFSVTDPNTSVSYTCGNASASSTMELTLLHKAPTINSYTLTETNPLLSGMGNLRIARYLSIKQYEIDATPYDNATITTYRVYNGTELLQESNGNIITVDYANVELQTNVVSGQTYAVIRIEAIDSLGGVGILVNDSVNKIIDYQKPNIITTSTNVKRNGQSTGKVNLNLRATFYNDTIGATTNAITMSFAYWKAGDTESTTYYTIPSSVITISGNDISITNWGMTKNNVLIEDIDPSYAYYFKIKIVDGFSKIGEAQILCTSGEYLIGRYKDRVDFKKITQKNIDVLTEGVVAYEDSDGTNGNVTLSYSSADYNHCIIFFRTNDSDTPESSVRIDNPNGKTAMLMGIQPYTSSSCYIKSKKVTISGTSITNVNYSQVQLRSSNYPTVSNDNNVYITKVIFF